LFQLHFLAGLDPDVFGPDPVALVEKVHHAVLDGVAGIANLSMVFDPAQDETAPVTSEQSHRATGSVRPASEPSSIRLAAAGIAGQLRTPGRLVTSAISSLRDPQRLAADLAAVTGALGDLVRPAASTSLNSHVHSRQRLLHPITFPLADVLDTGHQLGGTVNDVVLTAVSAGLRTLFEVRGETVDQQITALVPVSTRRSGAEGEPGNHVAAMIVELPVAEADLEAAFQQTATRISELKGHHRANGSDLLLEAANHLPPVAIDMICRTVTRQPYVNLVVTNVPGPPCPLSYRGGDVRSAVPIVPLGGNLSVSVAVSSYRDVLTIAFHADAVTCPDVAVLAEATQAALSQLAKTGAARSG
jgi:WS/DGAT/MGAT family acyltransferase